MAETGSGSWLTTCWKERVHTPPRRRQRQRQHEVSSTLALAYEGHHLGLNVELRKRTPHRKDRSRLIHAKHIVLHTSTKAKAVDQTAHRLALVLVRHPGRYASAEKS